MIHRRVLRAAACAAALLSTLLTPQAARAGQFELLSRAGAESDTAEGGQPQIHVPPAVSDDGRWIAFVSPARNLVPGQRDASPSRDLFLHDRQSGSTVLVSHAAGPSAAGDGDTRAVSISGDGRWIAYESKAGNLVPGQAPGDWSRVYLYDRDSGTNTLVAYRGSNPAVSADGLWIAFESTAPDLVPGQVDIDNFYSFDVFLQERATGTTHLASRADGTSATAAGGFRPSLSADGRYVAFASAATDLVPGFSGAVDNVFLYDRILDAMTLVSHVSGSATTGAGGDSDRPAVSADGSAVAYLSAAANLAAGQADANGGEDVFLFDRATGANVLVSRSAASPATAGNRSVERNTSPGISADGAYVVFAGRAYDAVPGEVNNFEREDLFLFARGTATLTLVSHASTSATQDGNAVSESPRLSADGRFVVFRSHATNIVPGQTDSNWVDDQIGGPDIFLFDRTTGINTLLSGAGGSASATGNRPSRYPALSADGAVVAFFTAAENLVPGLADLNMEDDLILQDREAGTFEVATLHAPGLPSGSAAEASRFLSASADGRYAVFLSMADNVVPGQSDGLFPEYDIFLLDRQTGSSVLVSHAAGSATTAANAWSSHAAISADGAWVVFSSAATDLAAGQNDVNQFGFDRGDVFLYERATGTVTLVSHAAGSPATTGDYGCGSFAPPAMSISADGRYIAFECQATDLVSGQVDDYNPGHGDVFLYDRVSGETVLVSRSFASAVTAEGGFSPVLSADGRWVAFTSDSSGLIFGGTGGGLFLYDRTTGQMLLVSRAAGTSSTSANDFGHDPLLSPDGRYVAFSSRATDLVAGQGDESPFESDDDAFLFDRATGTVELISRAAGSATVTGNCESTATAVSSDGRYVAFASRAGNLVPAQSDPDPTSWDVFVHDRATRVTELITRSSAASATALGIGGRALLSADARYLAFIPSFGPSALYLADRQLHLLERVAPADPNEAAIALSADAGTVFFTTAGAQAGNDFNGGGDAYAYVRTPAAGSDFFTLVPCRLLDTRLPAGGPALTPETPRVVTAHGACGIPATATALALNVTITGAAAPGYLALHPGNLSAPGTSTLNFKAGETRANNAVAALALNGEGTLAVTPFLGNGTVHVILDVLGWFE